jgi:anti-anti-sigma regulatory factor
MTGIRIAWRAPGVLVGTLGGDVDPPSFAAVLDELLSQAVPGSVTFLDLAALDYLDPAVRGALTRAIAKRRGRGVRVHVLATSPFVRLAASVAALELALVDVHWTNDRAAFESELATAVARRHRRTNAWDLLPLAS